jgi:hypothetical protein
MQLGEFKRIVAERSSEFSAHRKLSDAERSATESALGVSLPESLVWLLQTYGYSAACGVDNLSETVEATQRCRSTLQLPPNVVVLNDWNDAGVVLLEFGSASEPRVVWTTSHNLERLSSGQTLDGDRDEFANFAEWAIHRADDIRGDGS